MRGKKTPLADKARAVGIASVTSIAEASRQTGISQAAIHKWFHAPEYEELRSRNKDVRDDEWSVGVQLAFRRAVELLEKTEDPVKAATTGAILFDKLALSTGAATSRSETKDITNDLDPATRRRVIKWIDANAGADQRDSEDAGAAVR